MKQVGPRIENKNLWADAIPRRKGLRNTLFFTLTQYTSLGHFFCYHNFMVSFCNSSQNSLLKLLRFCPLEEAFLGFQVN